LRVDDVGLSDARRRDRLHVRHAMSPDLPRRRCDVAAAAAAAEEAPLTKY
jgi:hypothetical protein